MMHKSRKNKTITYFGIGEIYILYIDARKCKSCEKREFLFFIYILFLNQNIKNQSKEVVNYIV